MKNRTAKLVVAVLTLAIALGAAIGITSMAEETVAPEIISKNVAYNGNFALMYAVDKATVTGESLTLSVYSTEAADEASLVWSKTVSLDTATEEVGGVESYVITTPGVSAKDMGTEFYVQAVSGEAKSSVLRYSVAEYLYERLFKNGVVNATEGADLARKQFYYSVLEMGKNAENVLLNYDENPDNDVTTFVTDLYYVTVEDGGVDNANTAAVLSPGVAFTPIFDDTTLAEDYTFGGWNVKYYAYDGTVTEGTVKPDTAITATSHMVLTPALYYGPVIGGERGTGVYFNSENAGTRFVCNAVAKGNSYSDFDSRSSTATATLYGDYVVLDKGTSTGRPYFQYNNNTTKPADTTNLIQVAEADVAFGGLTTGANDPVNPYLFAFYFDKVYCAVYIDVTTDGMVGFNGSHAVNHADYRFAMNEWHNLRFEVYNTSGSALSGLTSASTSTLTVKVYVDGINVGDYRAMDAGITSNSNRMNANIQDVTSGCNNGAWIAVDNVYLGYDNKAYTEWLPDNFPELTGNHTGGVYYNGDGAGVRNDGSVVSFNSSKMEAKAFVPSDKFAYVYRTGTSGHATVNVLENIEYPSDYSNNATVIEFDYAMGNDLLTSYTALLNYRYGGNRLAMYFGYKNGKIILNNTIVTGEGLSLDPDTWYNLRFEIYGLEQVKVFVNNVWVGDYKGLDTGNTSDTTTLQLTLQGGKSATGYLAFDNVYIENKTATYVSGDPNAATE